jgi:hypothetical protein
MRSSIDRTSQKTAGDSSPAMKKASPFQATPNLREQKL